MPPRKPTDTEKRTSAATTAAGKSPERIRNRFPRNNRNMPLGRTREYARQRETRA